VNILFLGPQGSGKGTQAKLVAAEYGLAHVATGDMLRAAIAAGTELGRRVDETVKRGELVSDEVMVSLIRERLAEDDARDGFILDGFPRTAPQAEALDAMFAETGRELDVVFALLISDELCVERMLKRAREEGRADDTSEAIRTRLAEYHRETAPLIERYRTRGRVVGVHADRSVREVFAEVQEAVEQVAARAGARII
jgi:adenylate kinase